MILAPVIIYIVTLGIGYFYFASSTQNSTISTMKRIVKDHRQMIESFLAERQGDLSLVTDTYTYQELTNPEKLRTVFKKLQHKSGAFVDLGIFDQQGVHINYHGPYDLSGKNYRNEGWFKEVMGKGYYISNVFKGFRNVPHFVIAVVKVEKERKWVIRATIDTQLFNALVEQVSIGKTGEAYILNEDGVLQTSRRSGGELMEHVGKDSGTLMFHEGIRVIEQTNPGEENYLVATTWLNNRSWILVVR
ncbi:cache domain-containing protein, partial [bacterium]|nr:cache domain-containing protein [bacterium]